ncbi:hypothetical protein RIF29_16509 [Crotalaria pallida]|uniref:Uncharacterized protein n=1 Tax=Crotalaria pallida TaxID=3830 RepID=A0AAN9IC39_CROPI
MSPHSCMKSEDFMYFPKQSTAPSAKSREDRTTWEATAHSRLELPPSSPVLTELGPAQTSNIIVSETTLEDKGIFEGNVISKDYEETQSYHIKQIAADFRKQSY